MEGGDYSDVKYHSDLMAENTKKTVNDKKYEDTISEWLQKANKIENMFN